MNTSSIVRSRCPLYRMRFPVAVRRAVRRQPGRLGEWAVGVQSARRSFVGIDNRRLTRRRPELACASLPRGLGEPDISSCAPRRPHNPCFLDRRQIVWRLIALASVNVAFDLELFTPDSVSFVPVYLG